MSEIEPGRRLEHPEFDLNDWVASRDLLIVYHGHKERAQQLLSPWLMRYEVSCDSPDPSPEQRHREYAAKLHNLYVEEDMISDRMGTHQSLFSSAESLKKLGLILVKRFYIRGMMRFQAE